MNYELLSFIMKGATLDDAKKEFHVQVDILVGISGADSRFQTNNPNIDFVIKGFKSYDELASQIKQASSQWVATNYPNS